MLRKQRSCHSGRHRGKRSETDPLGFPESVSLLLPRCLPEWQLLCFRSIFYISSRPADIAAKEAKQIQESLMEYAFTAHRDGISSFINQHAFPRCLPEWQLLCFRSIFYISSRCRMGKGHFFSLFPKEAKQIQESLMEYAFTAHRDGISSFINQHAFITELDFRFFCRDVCRNGSFFASAAFFIFLPAAAWARGISGVRLYST
jgi:hypothetical protein